MSRLFIVSNRVPAEGQAADGGGLTVAVRSGLGREAAWFGWSGTTADDRRGGSEDVHSRQAAGIEYLLIDLTKRDVEEYYRGFANRTLWPLLHCRVDLAEIRPGDEAGYRRVNRLFARGLLPHLRHDDLIWIHDYHLIPLGEELRRLGAANRIGFFLHTPWPAADVWSALPASRALLTSFEAYDLIGLQTEFDVENFKGCLSRFGVSPDLPDRVGAYPVSIDTDQFAAMASRSRAHAIAKRFADRLGDRRFILGVDRLDYTKGIAERMLGYEEFLRRTPGARRRAIYVQVTPKSRSEVPQYAQLQREVAEIAGRINGALSEIDWTPIRYLNRGLRRDVLAGLYRLARVALVTPLRDGMNLVAKEFVAAQAANDPGVLVLSDFAGAARELGAALIVNPHDVDAMATAIGTAYAMPLDERQARWRSMFDHLRRNNAAVWCSAFLDALEAHPARSRAITIAVDRPAPGEPAVQGAPPADREAPTVPTAA